MNFKLWKDKQEETNNKIIQRITSIEESQRTLSRKIYQIECDHPHKDRILVERNGHDFRKEKDVIFYEEKCTSCNKILNGYLSEDEKKEWEKNKYRIQYEEHIRIAERYKELAGLD